jgi:endo-beta-N-acetylglucosaminidase D
MLLKVYYLKLAYFKDLWNYLDPKLHNRGSAGSGLIV